jgi:hypothetical protein
VGVSYFPLRDGVSWVYSVTDPLQCRLLTVRVRPPVEIEAEDMLTHEVRRERAWVLEESERDAPHYAVERDHGVEILRRRRFGTPERQALVVDDDLRWSGEAAWARPCWRYDLQTRRYRRAGDEEVTVTAGVFWCLKILLDEGETGTYWLAPGVGIVRSVGAIEGLVPQRFSVLELHSCILPEAPRDSR